DVHRLHRLVGGLKPNTPVSLSIELLDRSGRSVEQRDDHLAVIGALPLVDDDEITVPNLLVDHGITAHAKHIVAARPPNERFGDAKRLVVLESLDGHTGGDATEEGKLDGAGRCLRREDLDRPTL